MAGRLLVKVDYYMDRDLLSRVRPYTTMYSNISVGPLACDSLWDRSLPSVRSPFAASIHSESNLVTCTLLGIPMSN